MMNLNEIMIMVFPDFIIIKVICGKVGGYFIGFAQKLSIFIFPDFTVRKGLYVDPFFLVEGVDD